MHPADIKASLTKAGSSQVALARGLKNRSGKPLTQAAVFHVIAGATKSARIARRISEVTGIPVAQLWPGKYPELEKLDRAARGVSKTGAAALAAEIGALRRKQKGVA